MTVGVQRNHAVVVFSFALIVGGLTCVVQIGVQHVITAGDIQHTAICQHHAVRINLAQTQCQLSTVIHGNGVGIEFSCLFGQPSAAVAVQVEAVCCYATTVTDVQRRTISQRDAISKKT
ncbi:hypothetical protein D3C76_1493150 [compost metagenome]